MLQRDSSWAPEFAALFAVAFQRRVFAATRRDDAEAEQQHGSSSSSSSGGGGGENVVWRVHVLRTFMMAVLLFIFVVSAFEAEYYAMNLFSFAYIAVVLYLCNRYATWRCLGKEGERVGV